MALKFQWRSTSLDAYYAKAFKTGTTFGTRAISSDASGVSGVFGSKRINMGAKPYHAFMGMDNLNSDAKPISILMRFVPRSSGTPAAEKGILCTGITNPALSGFALKLTTAAKMFLFGANQDGNTWANSLLNSALTFVQDQPTDVWICWDGLSGSNIEIWQAQNGETATLLTSIVSTRAADTWNKNALTHIFTWSPIDNLQNDFLDWNELCIFDTKENPTSYGARTDFVSASAFEGYEDYPDETDVRDGVAYHDSSMTGSLVVPAVEDVRDGTAVDATTGTLDLPAEEDVLEGVEFDGASQTGTLVLVTNTFQNKKLIARSDADVNAKQLIVTQGDQFNLAFTAMSDKTTEMDLTGASLETKIKATTGYVTIADEDHTIDPDQTADGNRGKFVVLMSAANSALLNAADSKDVITKVTQGSSITHLHGTDLLDVIASPPVD